MDKHWANLLINAPARHYGNTIQSKAHHDTKRAEQDRRDREAGQAFCDRARINVRMGR